MSEATQCAGEAISGEAKPKAKSKAKAKGQAKNKAKAKGKAKGQPKVKAASSTGKPDPAAEHPETRAKPAKRPAAAPKTCAKRKVIEG